MVLKITPKQRVKINSLVRRTCCNCHKGKPPRVGEGEKKQTVRPPPPPTANTLNLFLKGVLPAEKELYAEILQQNGLG